MQEAEAVYEAILQAIREGESACVLTVIETRGATPREAGAKMLVRADGSQVGTIGGGLLEATAVADARQALVTGEWRVATYSLQGQAAEDLGICGGDARVFIELLRPKATLLVAGAGHVAQSLVAMGALLGFRVVIADDREEMLAAERFPAADVRLCVSFERMLERVAVTPQTHVVIVTRGHAHDEAVLRQVLSSPAAYIGMIGSRYKVKQVLERLSADVPPERLAQVRAPIGLGLGGRAPAEIALAILAEIVAAQHGGTGEPLYRRGNPLRASETGNEEDRSS